MPRYYPALFLNNIPIDDDDVRIALWNFYNLGYSSTVLALMLAGF